ncbi:MAG: sorbitol-6-phosphate dehydrogenase [Halanaerobiaceae bacterium]
MINLKGKTAIITGAARGLGKALAQALDEQGAQIVIGDIDIEGARETAAELTEATAIETDISNYEQCEKMAQTAVEKYGSIDLLVANAAILIAKSIEDFTSEEWKKVIDINLCGFFNTCKAVVPQMKKQGQGNIIQINSKSGKKGSFKNSAYASSKFGGIGLVQSLALELAEENIRVNAICPGNLLNSPLWQNKLFEEYAENRGITKEEVREMYINKVPMKKSCTYEDVAHTMLFLASDMSSYMTGQAINVTGGQQMD